MFVLNSEQDSLIQSSPRPCMAFRLGKILRAGSVISKATIGLTGASDGVCSYPPELDALGDELLLDDDSTYLDEASASPAIPEGMPSDSKTNKVKLRCCFRCSVPLFVCQGRTLLCMCNRLPYLCEYFFNMPYQIDFS